MDPEPGGDGVIPSPGEGEGEGGGDMGDDDD
jgi:hypothetical protein